METPFMYIQKGTQGNYIKNKSKVVLPIYKNESMKISKRGNNYVVRVVIYTQMFQDKLYKIPTKVT